MRLFTVTQTIKTNYHDLLKGKIVSATYNLDLHEPFRGKVKQLAELHMPGIMITQRRGASPEQLLDSLEIAQSKAKQFLEDSEKLKGVLQSVLRKGDKAIWQEEEGG